MTTINTAVAEEKKTQHSAPADKEGKKLSKNDPAVKRKATFSHILDF